MDKIREASMATLLELSAPDRFFKKSVGRTHRLMVAVHGAQQPLPSAFAERDPGLQWALRHQQKHLRTVGFKPPLVGVIPSTSLAATTGKEPIVYLGGLHRSIHVLGKGTILNTDVVVVDHEHPATVVMQTRDCPVIVLLNDKSGDYAVVHGMRDLLAPDERGQNMVSTALDAVAPHVNERPSVYLYATAGVSAAAFPNYPEKAAPFLKHYGEPVFGDVAKGELDLFLVARETVQRLGVPADHCLRDTLCTVTTPWLGSLRGNKPRPNSVFVSLQ